MSSPLMACRARLIEPFPVEVVEVKPGAVNHDGTKALVLAYVDWRLYAQRLDAVVGPEHWSITLTPWGAHRIIATLTMFGISKSSTGEGAEADPHGGTIAEAQAKKRACAEFGLGRYLYLLPTMWGLGEGNRQSFRFQDARRLVHTLYLQAGLIPPEGSAGIPPAPPTSQPASLPQARLVPHTGPATAGETPATEPQRRLLVKLLTQARQQHPAHVRALSETFGLALATVRDLATLPVISKGQASAVIHALQAESTTNGRPH